MNKILLKFTLLCLLIFGCNTDEVFLSHFTDEGILSYSLVEELPDFVNAYPLRMIKSGNVYIISFYKGDKVFAYIDIESRKGFQFGVRGRGPGEFNDGYGLASLSDSTFIVYDRVLKKVSYFKLENDTVHNYYETNVPAIYNVYPYNDSVFVTNGNIPFDKNYGVLDVSNKTTYSYIDFPPTNAETPKPFQLRAYYSHLVRRPNSNTYMSFKSSHHIIDILRLDNLTLHLEDRKIFYQYDWEYSNNIPVPSVSGTLHLFTARIAGSENHVFACYQIPNDETSKWCLLSFDWKGNPCKRYSIPFKPYTLVCANDTTVYTIGINSEKYNLIEFNISDR